MILPEYSGLIIPLPPPRTETATQSRGELRSQVVSRGVSLPLPILSPSCQFVPARTKLLGTRNPTQRSSPGGQRTAELRTRCQCAPLNPSWLPGRDRISCSASWSKVLPLPPAFLPACSASVLLQLPGAHTAAAALPHPSCLRSWPGPLLG